MHDPISANTGESRFEAVSSRVSSRCPQADGAADETPLGEGEEGGEEEVRVSQLRFRFTDGQDIAPQEWLRLWAHLYRAKDDPEYRALIAKHNSLTAEDFERIGKWKDAASGKRWRPNVASVAYKVWMQAAKELPECPSDNGAADFLMDWSQRKYTDRFKTGVVRKKHFGLARATTLLHFISGGRFPILDSQVRKAIALIAGCRVSNTVSWYINSYIPLFRKIAAACNTSDPRMLDKALVCYAAYFVPP